ncbi:MAG: galactosyltransferase-related protein [Hasllibacter sp.]
MTVSVLTLIRGRRAHLENVMAGLARQTRLPDELVIGVMEPLPLTGLPEMPFPVRQVRVAGDELPLAKARNAVASAARGHRLIFLDVDCIPAPEFVATYERGMDVWDGMLMGEVMYLPKGATDGGLDFERFASTAERHSDRQAPPPFGIRPCDDYRCFWSLNFAMPRAVWDRSGGFCEDYVGYGGEDTDYGRVLDERGIRIGWLKGGLCYHQYHPHHMPPVHHIGAILRNTRIFRDRWGEYTMGHWLHAFEMMGLIAKNAGEGSGWTVLREPSEEDLALTRQQEHMPYANSARVIRMLERQRAKAVAAE